MPLAPAPDSEADRLTISIRRDQRPLGPALTVSSPWVYAAAVLASLLLSAWAAYAEFVPNPDAALYLRAAKLFSEGAWASGLDVYRWPFYSILIAALMTVVPDAIVAAQVLNAFLYLISTLAFIGLISRLAGGGNLVVIVAALMVVFHPQLTQLRAGIIRDNGYLAFLLLAFYLIVRDQAIPRAWTKIAIGISIVLAGLFRIEGFLIAGLIPLYYTYAQGGWRRWVATLSGTAILMLLLLPASSLWGGGSPNQWFSGQSNIGVFQSFLGPLEIIGARITALRSDLPPPSWSSDWVAYGGMVVAVAAHSVVRAITPPLALLAGFGLSASTEMSREARSFVVWFTLLQIPLLLLFTGVNLYLDWRYAMGVALLMTVPAACAVVQLCRGWGAGNRTAKLGLPITALILLASWVSDFPTPNGLGYLREAGRWIQENVPAETHLLTNDSRITYFSERRPGERTTEWAGLEKGTVPLDIVNSVDVVALAISNERGVPDPIASSGKDLLVQVEGEEGHRVVIFRMRH